MDWFGLIRLLAPIILEAAIPDKRVGAILATVATDGMIAAQQIPGATNDQKKASVMTLVTDTLTGIAAVKPDLVPAPDVLTAAASSAIDTAIQVTNYVRDQVLVPIDPASLPPAAPAPAV
ncbi:MAG TPA: hypothetical protein VKR23_15980 [Gaiellaceae bacterium]|nr:hypothetical protein [Gaiellaceae bacterium]